MVQKCDCGGEYQFYPRGICANCWSTDIQWVKSSGKGTVCTFTVTHQNRSLGIAEEVPYVLALLELEEGARMFTNIIECDPRDAKFGMPVEVTFVRASNRITVPSYKPAGHDGHE